MVKNIGTKLVKSDLIQGIPEGKNPKSSSTMVKNIGTELVKSDLIQDIPEGKNSKFPSTMVKNIGTELIKKVIIQINSLFSQNSKFIKLWQRKSVYIFCLKDLSDTD